MNVVVSMMKARGGSPSGAFGMPVYDVVVKRDFTGVMSAIGKAMMMDREAGVTKPKRMVRRFEMIFWRRVRFALDGRATADSEVKEGSVGLVGMIGEIGWSPWTIVGAGEVNREATGEANRDARAASECGGTMVVPPSS